MATHPRSKPKLPPYKGGPLHAPAHVNLHETREPDPPRTLEQFRARARDAERAFVLAALTRHNGRVTDAAAELGVSRQCLYGLAGRLHLGEWLREASPGPGRKANPSPAA